VDSGVLAGFAVVFVVVGGLELVDRTSFALIALSTRNRPIPTWAGAAVAFVLATALAVLLGSALEAGLGPERISLIRIGGGTFLIGYAAWLALHREKAGETVVSRAGRPAFVAAFLTIFLLELGDTTMIFEVVFVANFGAWLVFSAGALALVIVAAWDVTLGRGLSARLRPESLDRVVVVVLVVVGALTIAYGLRPAAFAGLATIL
jgi:putative Ca2+/H+ antiporter (TMEM165/GDT1 family)